MKIVQAGMGKMMSKVWDPKINLVQKKTGTKIFLDLKVFFQICLGKFIFEQKYYDCYYIKGVEKKMDS